MTQVLTGHGCFGEYLCQIGKKPTAQCHECGAANDSAQHTLKECSNLAEQRRKLVVKTRENSSLEAFLRVFVSKKKDVKTAAVSFCEFVIEQKEAAERDREKEPDQVRQRAAGAATPLLTAHIDAFLSYLRINVVSGGRIFVRGALPSDVLRIGTGCDKRRVAGTAGPDSRRGPQRSLFSTHDAKEIKRRLDSAIARGPRDGVAGCGWSCHNTLLTRRESRVLPTRNKKTWGGEVSV